MIHLYVRIMKQMFKQNYLLLVMLLLLLLLNVFDCRLKLLHLTKVKVDLGLETVNFSVTLVNLVLQTTLPSSICALCLNLRPTIKYNNHLRT